MIRPSSPLTMLLSRHTRRREFITLLGSAAAAWPLAARAQTKRARIGWFTVAPHPYIDGFRQGLRELGWIEGENLAIEPIYADGHPERLPGLASVLARVPYDLVVASGSDAVEAARAAIQSIPIVGVSSSMGTGGSLARSEGNLSGVALLFDEVATKWPELLIEMVPRVQRICVLFDPSLSGERQSEAVGTTATKLGKTLLPIRIGNVDPSLMPSNARVVKGSMGSSSLPRQCSLPMRRGSSSSCNVPDCRRSMRRVCWSIAAGYCRTGPT